MTLPPSSIFLLIIVDPRLNYNYNGLPVRDPVVRAVRDRAGMSLMASPRLPVRICHNALAYQRSNLLKRCAVIELP